MLAAQRVRRAIGVARAASRSVAMVPEPEHPGIPTSTFVNREAMRSVTKSTGDIQALAAARNAIDAALSMRLARMDESREHEVEGASSIGTWPAPPDILG